MKIENVTDQGFDVVLTPSITLMMSFEHGSDRVPAVWGVQIDGQIYREPRDLTGEILRAGPFAEWCAQRLGVPDAA